jgi:hypothetical protein
MPSKEAVEMRLWAMAQDRAAGFGFAPGCEGLVLRLVRTGVQRLEAEGFLDDGDRIAIAEANLTIFISEMVIAARGFGLLELHENTFGEALRRLCPLFPFC